MISASSLTLLARAAAVAPPATPPTITNLIAMFFPSNKFICFYILHIIVFRNKIKQPLPMVDLFEQ
jgi:hypothetical protein